MLKVKATPVQLRAARKYWRTQVRCKATKKADGPPFHKRSAKAASGVSVSRLVDSLDKLARVVAASEMRNEQVKRTAIAESCMWAARLQKSKPLWQGFIAEPRWLSAGGARPKEVHRPEALRFVLRWAFGLTGDVTDTANFYHRAVAPLLAEGIPPERVVGEIKRRGGLKKLAEAHAKTKLKAIPERVEAAPRRGPNRLAEAQAKPKMPKVVDEKAETAPTCRPPKDTIVLTIRAHLDTAAERLLRLPTGSKANLHVTLDAVGKVINLTIHDVAGVKSDRS